MTIFWLKPMVFRLVGKKEEEGKRKKMWISFSDGILFYFFYFFFGRDFIYFSS